MLSYQLAKAQGARPWKVIGEHLIIAVAVITTAHFIGDWVSASFK